MESTPTTGQLLWRLLKGILVAAIFGYTLGFVAYFLARAFDLTRLRPSDLLAD